MNRVLMLKADRGPLWLSPLRRGRNPRVENTLEVGTHQIQKSANLGALMMRSMSAERTRGSVVVLVVVYLLS